MPHNTSRFLSADGTGCDAEQRKHFLSLGIPDQHTQTTGAARSSQSRAMNAVRATRPEQQLRTRRRSPWHRLQLPFVALFSVAALIAGLGGCSSYRSEQERRQRDEKTREEAAKITERAKPKLEAAGKALGRAAATAAEEAHAAAEGVKEGWASGGHQTLDLNSATESELMELPGVNHRDARRIIHGRPYRNKHELVTKGILSEVSYAKIRDDITTNK
jgi:DNA uptake protein ComE-like DNA-binding protein